MAGEESVGSANEADQSTCGSEQLEAELLQSFETLVATLKRRDEIREKTGEDPLENVGHIIKAAGMIRDQIPPGKVSRSADIDPDEVLDS